MTSGNGRPVRRYQIILSHYTNVYSGWYMSAGPTHCFTFCLATYWLTHPPKKIKPDKLKVSALPHVSKRLMRVQPKSIISSSSSLPSACTAGVHKYVLVSDCPLAISSSMLRQRRLRPPQLPHSDNGCFPIRLYSYTCACRCAYITFNLHRTPN